MRDFERAALIAAGSQPLPLDDRPCWGRADATICDDCTLLRLPTDTAAGWPELQIILPAVEHIGTDAEFCPNRRSAGMPRAAAACGGCEGSVCAESNVTHGPHGAPPAGQGEPLEPAAGGTLRSAGVANISTGGRAA